jgi:hypothetical protein
MAHKQFNLFSISHDYAGASIERVAAADIPAQIDILYAYYLIDYEDLNGDRRTDNEDSYNEFLCDVTIQLSYEIEGEPNTFELMN